MAWKWDLTAEELAAKEMAEALAQSFMFVPLGNLQAVVNKVDSFEAFSPILDPGAYMQARRHLPEHKTLLKAALEFRLALEKLIQENKDR